ncbi:transcription termination/antitermination protein NusA [Candidatus Aerophobetes bacterium]|uniref:Transcription termination/antitermination protein NusA n=1 Tax=Aerophobetes bacterium TaxID=2030807 RepID=A0A523UX61_UNCAE|nr:MAG: transcription termination/antitermination protein NusA [Candidatus Aerophobetes bacterium]
MQDSEFFFLLERIGRERGLSMDALLESIKEALASAYKKKYNEPALDLRLILDKSEGKVQVMVTKEVVEKVENPGREISLEGAKRIDKNLTLGQRVEVEVDPVQFSRIAASTGKYVMMQQIVEIEKDMIYEEFKKREGEMISGTVRYRTDYFVLIDLGRTEGILPEREQLANRRYRQGERIRAYILKVTRESKGPRITLSQTHPNFLRKLFELEVPEVGEGIVKVREIKRDPGRRAKVVVESKEERVDPVGACVGVRGSRIKAILIELEGERVDIIRYSEDPAIFVKNSLKPAEVLEVKLDETSQKAKAIVADDQLSLAIGSRGENVKLAAKLTGWQIDIRSVGQIKEEAAFLKDLPGVGEKIVESLKQAGFLTVKDIVREGTEDLLKVPGIGPKTAERIFNKAKEIAN